jgi:short-subunit dehydrogenase
MAKALSEQVVVITGASSGIGRETALKFSQEGAKVVLAARNETGLIDLAAEIRVTAGEVLVVPTDVSQWAEVQHLAQEALNWHGRIDTWVNDAAVNVYGLVEETPVEEFEQIIHVNLLGTIYGVKAVLPIMKQQGYGTIINVGSVVSERAMPLQAGYTASKFGVRGFTDALRLEMERQYPNINVTLILPASINTPFFEHARSHMSVEPKPLPPVYDPSLAAEAIVHAAEHPERNVYVGGASKMFSMMERLSPALTDRFLLFNDWVFESQQGRMPNTGRDTLDAPTQERGQVRGNFGYLMKSSMYPRLFDFTPNWLRLGLPTVLLASLLLIKRVRSI